MKGYICDVCEDFFSEEVDMIEAVIPAVMLGAEGEPLAVDICSVECLAQITAAEKEEEPEAQQIKAPEPKQMPLFGENASPELMEELTEKATGVRRKY